MGDYVAETEIAGKVIIVSLAAKYGREKFDLLKKYLADKGFYILKDDFLENMDCEREAGQGGEDYVAIVFARHKNQRRLSETFFEFYKKHLKKEEALDETT